MQIHETKSHKFTLRSLSLTLAGAFTRCNFELCVDYVINCTVLRFGPKNAVKILSRLLLFKLLSPSLTISFQYNIVLRFIALSKFGSYIS